MSFAFIQSFFRLSWKLFMLTIICSHFTKVFRLYVCYLTSNCVCFTRRIEKISWMASHVSTLKIVSTLWPKCGAMYCLLNNSNFPSKQNILWAKQTVIPRYLTHTSKPFHSLYRYPLNLLFLLLNYKPRNTDYKIETYLTKHLTKVIRYSWLKRFSSFPKIISQ